MWRENVKKLRYIPSDRSDWNGFPYMWLEKDSKPHTNVAQNRFHVVRSRSDNLNMIGFQSELHKNWIWADSLNEALVNTSK